MQKAELTGKELPGELFLWEGYNKLEVAHQKVTGKDIVEQIIWTNRPFHIKKEGREDACLELGMCSTLLIVVEVLSWLEISTKYKIFKLDFTVHRSASTADYQYDKPCLF